MRKGKTYHNLLKRYIKGIGCTDCPARREEVSDCCQKPVGEATRTVGRVVERNGYWEIHLFTVDRQCPCRLQRQRIRTFRTRRMAEIVARYTKAAQGEGPESPNIELAPICWN